MEPGCGGAVDGRRKGKGRGGEFRGSGRGEVDGGTFSPGGVRLREGSGHPRHRAVDALMSSNRRRRDAPAPPDKWGLGPWIFLFLIEGLLG